MSANPTQASELVRPVILCGGAGTRLWPVSRLAFPKQLLPIAHDKSMLQVTASRVSGSGFAAPIIVGDEEHRFFVLEQLGSNGDPPASVILEPAARSTAPAIGIAASWIMENCGDELMLVLPSDHVISDEANFLSAVTRAIPTAKAGGLVTFGIVPDRANTGYGYIELGEEHFEEGGVQKIVRFVEKPDSEQAQKYYESNRYMWNSGMFLFRASVILDELSQHAPEVAKSVNEAATEFENDGLFVRPGTIAFDRCPKISIDFAVMEATSNAFVLPVDIGWSDVGSWSSLWDISDKDPSGNVVQGRALTLETNDCLIRSDDDEIVVTIGVNRLGIIVSRDAVLVTDLDRSQEVKAAVDMLRKQGDDAVFSATEVFRPWGSYQTTDKGDRFQTKRIVVKPGARLSLQKHHHRSEHWVVVSGTAEVTVGDDVRLLQENESTYVPAGTMHRLGNPGKVPLHLIEVQCGPYLGEDDIVRVEDEYGRLAKK